MKGSNLLKTKFQRLLIYFQLQWSRLASFSIAEILKRVLRKGTTLFLAVTLLPISIILYVAGFRRLCFFTDRIGHLAIEPDTLLKAQSLNLIKTKRWFVLAPKHRVANQHLLKYWESHFIVFRSTFLCFLLHSLSLWSHLRYDVSHFINNDNGSQLAYTVNKLWDNRPPILSLTEDDKKWGESQLIKLGIPKDAWFVCIHVREGGFSPVDEILHYHRNGKIENLYPAIEEITGRGGFVVRLGDPTMKPMKKMPQVIDYAHHPLRSDRFDIILCARARFILGNTSGMFIVGTIFGVPSALANMIPMPTLGFSPDDISIPKLLWLEKEAKYMTFSQVMNSSVSTFRYASLYEKNKIIAIENTPEDILSLTCEMLDRLEGRFIENNDDKNLHAKYFSLIKPRHYAYGAASKINLAFLHTYQDLLQDV